MKYLIPVREDDDSEKLHYFRFLVILCNVLYVVKVLFHPYHL